MNIPNGLGNLDILVIGGTGPTGPTGPHIVDGVVERSH